RAPREDRDEDAPALERGALAVEGSPAERPNGRGEDDPPRVRRQGRSERREARVLDPRELVLATEEETHVAERRPERDERDHCVARDGSRPVSALRAREGPERERRDERREDVVRVDRDDGPAPCKEPRPRSARPRRVREPGERDERGELRERVGPSDLGSADERRVEREERERDGAR